MDLVIDLPSDKPFSPSFEQMGSETGYIISNMFFPLFCICFYLMTVIIHIIIYNLFKRCNNGKYIKKMTNYSKEVIFGFEGFIIRTIIELSLDISICGLMEIFMRQTVNGSEMISYFIALSFFLIHLSCMHFWSKFIKNNWHKIVQPRIYENFH